MKDYIPPPSSIGAGARAWCYLRDSGGEAQEMSVTQQTTAIKSYCQRSALTLTRAFADEAKSGTTDAGRDSFHDMIYLAEHDDGARPDILLVWSLSRFGRNFDDSQYYRAKLRKSGVVVHSLTDSIPDGKWGRVVEAMIDASNQDKSEQTSRDVQRALHDLARQGFAPGGVPPRGYKAEPVIIGHKRNGQPRKVSRWVEDPDLWEVCKLAWAMMSEGKGYRAIAEATGGKVYKSKGCWATFFRNKTYLGILKGGDEEFEAAIPAMIDRETWDAVQRIHAERTQHSKRARPHAGMLSGLAFCDHCGASMTQTQNKKWRYYVCGKKNRQGPGACPARRVAADNAEARILDAVIERVFTPDMAQALIAEVQAQIADTESFDREAAQLERQIADAQRKIDHLHDQIENFGARRSTQERLGEREREKGELFDKRAELEARRAVSEITVTSEALAAVINAWLDDL